WLRLPPVGPVPLVGLLSAVFPLTLKVATGAADCGPLLTAILTAPILRPAFGSIPRSCARNLLMSTGFPRLSRRCRCLLPGATLMAAPSIATSFTALGPRPGTAEAPDLFIFGFAALFRACRLCIGFGAGF